MTTEAPPNLEFVPILSFEAARQGLFDSEQELRVVRADFSGTREDRSQRIKAARTGQGHFMYQLLLNRKLGQSSGMSVGIADHEGLSIGPFSSNRVYFRFQTPSGEKVIENFIDFIGMGRGGTIKAREIIGQPDFLVPETAKGVAYRVHEQLRSVEKRISKFADVLPDITESLRAEKSRMIKEFLSLVIAKNKRGSGFRNVTINYVNDVGDGIMLSLELGEGNRHFFVADKGYAEYLLNKLGAKPSRRDAR